MDLDYLSGKKVVVMGLGRFGGGLDAARFAAKSGADVIVTDLADADELRKPIAKLSDLPQIRYHLGSHRDDDFGWADIVIVNPAIPATNEFVQIAANSGRTITSQVAVFFRLCPAKIIGVTGSNGKSTTAALTAHILRSGKDKGYGNVWFSGNIGNEPLLMLLDEIRPDDLVVLELSSFQIEQLAAEHLAPHVALLTNLLPNHLDRYGTFEEYCEAKKLVFQNQKSKRDVQAISLFNRDDALARRWYEEYKIRHDRRCLTFSADDVGSAVREKFTLPGRCNLANLAGAAAIAKLFGFDHNAIVDCIGGFKALPHRLEFIAEHNGVRWFNDSKATTPEASIAALNAFENRIILIAGGYDKHLRFNELGKTVAAKAVTVALIGATAKKIKAAIESAGPHKTTAIVICSALADAVAAADKAARPGDVVLLSPACASFDMFDNYEHRGNEFVRLVRQLPPKL
jgi:UDP-N-acetylmuramoylalanine--D-glutamate ligase